MEDLVTCNILSFGRLSYNVRLHLVSKPVSNIFFYELESLAIVNEIMILEPEILFRNYRFNMMLIKNID